MSELENEIGRLHQLIEKQDERIAYWKQQAKEQAIRLAEYLRLNYQNSPLEFDNNWQDMSFNIREKLTSAEVVELFLKEDNK